MRFWFVESPPASSNSYINPEQSDNALIGFSSETMLKCLVILLNAVAADQHTPLRHTGAPPTALPRPRVSGLFTSEVT